MPRPRAGLAVAKGPRLSPSAARLEPFRCATCGFALARPIARLRVATLALHDDARFPGRSVVALDAHATAIEELPLDVAAALAQDVRDAALAVRAETGAPRINYAAFGNVVPHVHVHVIPRHGPWDSAPLRTAWDHPAPESPLAAGEAERLVGAIRAALPARLRP